MRAENLDGYQPSSFSSLMSAMLAGTALAVKSPLSAPNIDRPVANHAGGTDLIAESTTMTEPLMQFELEMVDDRKKVQLGDEGKERLAEK